MDGGSLESSSSGFSIGAGIGLVAGKMKVNASLLGRLTVLMFMYRSAGSGVRSVFRGTSLGMLINCLPERMGAPASMATVSSRYKCCFMLKPTE